MRRAWMGLFVCLGLVGCKTMNEKLYVSERFSTLFDCKKPKVSAEAGGYRAEGCGTVAHFTCFDPDGEAYEPEDEEGLDGLLAAMSEQDTCILEHSKKSAPRIALEQRVAAAEQNPVERTQMDDGVQLKTRAHFTGGHLVAIGKPEQYADRVLLTVNTLVALPEGTCKAQLFIDGTELPIQQVVRHNAHAVRLLVRVDALRDAGRAQRIAGAVCGRELELDELGRKALGLFQARFREERARVAGSTSGGESVAAAPRSVPAPESTRTIIPAPPPAGAAITTDEAAVESAPASTP